MVILTAQEIERHLKERAFATVVTANGGSMASRTMMFGFVAPDAVYLITRSDSAKIGHIRSRSSGLLHLSGQGDDLSAAFDISVRGAFQEIAPDSTHYQTGVGVLAAKNPMVRDIAGSSMRDAYTMLKLNVSEIQGWTYQQAADGLPKTQWSGGPQ